MSISESLLPEFDHEMASTRKTLERIPEDKLDWKPHEKSTTLGNLAAHIANMPSWVEHTLGKDALDLAPPGEEPPRAAPINSAQEVLEIFDKHVAEARAAIAGATDEQMFQPWTLLKGGNALMTLPKAAVLRSFVMNHIIHHRAQLGVYLRLNDVPVPSVYGPSADEVIF